MLSVIQNDSAVESRVCTRLLFDFAKYKCFEELTEQLALVVKFGGATIRLCCTQ
jgi:hypothetical protein